MRPNLCVVLGLWLWLTPGMAWAATPVDWTLMVYIAADNDLERAALIDLDEMERGMPASGVEVIALVDRAEGYADGYGDWSDARVLRIRPDSETGVLASEELLRLGEINTGDPVNVTNFVQYATKNFPARRYGLVMWDHGGGWQGMADDENPGQGREHDNLSLSELSGALSQAVPKGNKLDLIGFDMCLMAQVEIAYEMAPFANYMVASQAVEPGYGWPYDRLLPEFAMATAGPRRLATNIVQRYADYTEQANERVSTQSAIDLSQMEPVREAIDAMANRLGPNTTSLWPALARSVFWADSFNPRGKDSNRKEDKNSLSSSDLLDVVKRARATLGTSFPAEAEFQKLVGALDGAIIDSRVSARHKLSHGLSIYAPPSGATFNEAYLQTRFGQSSSWPRLIRAVHYEAQKKTQAPKITLFKYADSNTGAQQATTSMLDATTLRLKVEGNNLLWVQALTGQHSPEDGGHLILSKGYMTDTRFLAEKLATQGDAAELLMPTFKGNSASMEMEVSPSTFTVSNGVDFGFATFDSTELQRGEGQSVSISALYDSEEHGKHRAVITFNMLTWEADGLVLLVKMKDGRVIPRGLKPQPNDKVTLLFDFIPDGKSEPQLKEGQTLTWGDGLELIMSEVPNGTYTTWALAENLSGESHSVSTSVRGVDAQFNVKAGFDDARQLSIGQLAGVWSDAQGTPAFAIGEQIGKGSLASMLIDRSALPPEAKDYQFFVQLDNRLLPILSLLTFDGDGENLLGREVVLLLADASQPDRLWIKTLVGGGGQALGEVIEVTRTAQLEQQDPATAETVVEENPDVTPNPTPDPGPVPDPIEQLSVVGSWQGYSQSGTLVWLELLPDGTFQQLETTPDETVQVQTWGVYEQQNGVLAVQFMGGEQCNPWGCAPFMPPQLNPFPIQLNQQQLQTPWASLERQY